jgi:hypothetical protein
MSGLDSDLVRTMWQNRTDPPCLGEALRRGGYRTYQDMRSGAPSVNGVRLGAGNVSKRARPLAPGFPALPGVALRYAPGSPRLSCRFADPAGTGISRNRKLTTCP